MAGDLEQDKQETYTVIFRSLYQGEWSLPVPANTPQEAQDAAERIWRHAHPGIPGTLLGKPKVHFSSKQILDQEERRILSEMGVNAEALLNND